MGIRPPNHFVALSCFLSERLPQTVTPSTQSYTAAQFVNRMTDIFLKRINPRLQLSVLPHIFKNILPLGQKIEITKQEFGEEETKTVIYAFPDSVITETTWENLRLFKETACSRLDKAITTTGKLFLYNRVATPTAEVEVLKKRQAVLTDLKKEENREILAGIKTDLSRFAKEEGHLLSFWDVKTMLKPGRVTKLYFKYFPKFDNWANSISFLVTMNAISEIVKDIFSKAFQIVAVFAMPTYALSQTGLLSEGLKGALNAYVTRFSANSGIFYSLAHIVPFSHVKIALGLFAGVVAALSLKENLQYMVADLKVDNMMHRKMYGVAESFKSMKEIYNKIKGTEIEKHFEHFSQLKDFIENEKNTAFFNCLESPTFNTEASFFLGRGNVLVPWKMLESAEFKKGFEKAIVALGEMDTVCTTIDLLDNGFYLPSFNYEGTMEEPFIETIEEAYSLDADKSPVIPLSFHFKTSSEKKEETSSTTDVSEASRTIFPSKNLRHIILTGKNDAGKSTFLRNILTITTLAQSLGVVPCKHFRLQPVDRLHSAMLAKQSENTGAYKGQLQIKEDLKQEIRENPNKKFVVICDEFLNTSKHEDNIEQGINFLKELDAFPNVRMIYSTHSVAITELATEQNNFTNYKAVVQEGIRSVVPGTDLTSNGRELAEEVAAAAAAERTGM